MRSDRAKWRRLPGPLGPCGRLILATFLIASIPDAVRAGVDIRTSGGPGGGNVPALAIDPNTPQTLYAGTLGGVFKSPGGG